jgi:hypothetical protein
VPCSPDSSEILSAIRAAARELGRAPTRSEFTRLSGISHFKVLALFSSLRDAVRQAGFQPNPQGLRISSSALLQDWGEVARKLRCLPSRSQYLRHGRYSAGGVHAALRILDQRPPELCPLRSRRRPRR